MYDSLYNHVRNTILGSQRAFVRCRSRVSNLACYLDLDLSKAFDSLWQPLLIHKLKSYGYSGQCIQWLQPYLLNRKQRVVLEGKVSDWKPVLSGVPTVSQIGPLLFILFVNDLTDHVDSCEISLYAGASKLFREISSVTYCESVQKASSQTVCVSGVRPGTSNVMQIYAA